jgi:hypothetical protein
MAAATLSVVVLLAFLEAAPEIRVPFRVDSHHSSKIGGKSQGGRRDRNQPYRESPQRECITLDRIRCWQRACPGPTFMLCSERLSRCWEANLREKACVLRVGPNQD